MTFALTAGLRALAIHSFAPEQDCQRPSLYIAGSPSGLLFLKLPGGVRLATLPSASLPRRNPFARPTDQCTLMRGDSGTLLSGTIKDTASLKSEVSPFVVVAVIRQ